MAKCYLLTNEVNVELNMLRTAMVDGIDGEVDGGDVVTVDNRGLGDHTKQLLKKLTEPRALSNGVSHCPILRLGTRARDRGLPLGRPRYQQRHEVDTIA